jgi:hypothetical protein
MSIYCKLSHKAGRTPPSVSLPPFIAITSATADITVAPGERSHQACAFTLGIESRAILSSAVGKYFSASSNLTVKRFFALIGFT